MAMRKLPHLRLHHMHRPMYTMAAPQQEVKQANDQAEHNTTRKENLFRVETKRPTLFGTHTYQTGTEGAGVFVYKVSVHTRYAHAYRGRVRGHIMVLPEAQRAPKGVQSDKAGKYRLEQKL